MILQSKILKFCPFICPLRASEFWLMILDFQFQSDSTFTFARLPILDSALFFLPRQRTLADSEFWTLNSHPPTLKIIDGSLITLDFGFWPIILSPAGSFGFWILDSGILGQNSCGGLMILNSGFWPPTSLTNWWFWILDSDILPAGTIHDFAQVLELAANSGQNHEAAKRVKWILGFWDSGRIWHVQNHT